MKEDLASLSVKELLERAESAVTDFRWGYSELFSAALKKIDSETQPELAEELRSEGLLWDIQRDRRNRGRLGPQFTGEQDDGTPVQYPDLSKHFPSTRLAYYKRQLSITNNPRRLARYGEVLWQLDRDADAARIAVKAYLESIDFFYEAEWDHEISDALEQGIRISLELNDAVLLRKCVEAADVWIDKLLAHDRPRWILEIGRAVIGVYRQGSGNFDFKKLERVLGELALVYEEEHSFLLEKGFLETICDLKAAESDSDGLRTARVRIAEAFVREGDYKKENSPKGGLVSAKFYEDAIRAYERAGDCEEEIQRVAATVQKSNRAAAEEMTPISTSIEIKKAELDEFAAPYDGKSPLDILHLLCVDSRLLGSLEEARELAVEQAKEFVVSQLFGTSIIRHGVTVRHVVEPEGKLEHQAITNFQMGYLLTASVWLRQIFIRLDLATEASRDALKKHLAATGVVGKDRQELILRGVDRYRDNDSVSAIHILVFQVEGLLRDFLEHIGLPIFKRHRGGEFRVKTLGDCIDALREGVGIDPWL